MRNKSVVKAVKTVLVIVPLLGSDGGVDASVIILPDCQEGQLVGIKPDKTLSCVSVPGATLNIPDCSAATQVLTSVRDSVTGNNVVSCINKGTGMNDVDTVTRITVATTYITNLQTSLTLLTTGSGTRPKYIGATTALFNGAVTSGMLKGIRAANKLCESEYVTGAYMCTPFDIYESLIIGDKLTGNADVGPLMVYMESWQPLTTVVAGSEPYAGMAENCGGHTYPTSDRYWNNTFFTFSAPTSSTSRVAKFDTRIPCSTTAKIACCK